MTARRKAAGIAAAGIAPLALTVLTASPAAAHGSMTDPVSRVSACYAEGPESPQSAACKAAVQAGGTQALYDWNGVRDGNAGGQSQEKHPGRQALQRRQREVQGPGPAPRRLALLEDAGRQPHLPLQGHGARTRGPSSCTSPRPATTRPSR